MFPFFVSFVLRRKEKVCSCWTKHHLLPVDCSTHTLSLSFLSFSHASDWLAKVLSQFFFLPRHIRSDSVYLWCLWLPCVAKRKSTLLISRAQSHPRIFPNNTRTLTLYFIHPNAQTLFYTHVWTLSLSRTHKKCRGCGGWGCGGQIVSNLQLSIPQKGGRGRKGKKPKKFSSRDKKRIKNCSLNWSTYLPRKVSVDLSPAFSCIESSLVLNELGVIV